jgi:hypothetical protein
MRQMVPVNEDLRDYVEPVQRTKILDIIYRKELLNTEMAFSYGLVRHGGDGNTVAWLQIHTAFVVDGRVESYYIMEFRV